MVFPLLLLMLSITYPCCNLVMLLILTHRLLLLIFTTAKSPFIFDSFLFHSRFQHKKSCHTKKAYTATKVNGENEIYAYEKRIAINAFSFVVSGFAFFFSYATVASKAHLFGFIVRFRFGDDLIACLYLDAIL